MAAAGSMFIAVHALDRDARLHYLRTPQGKVAELRAELNAGGKKDKNHSAKKITLKKIVANMTMSNNDMIALFPDIVGCMSIPSLEIKKMSVREGWIGAAVWRIRFGGGADAVQVLPLPGKLCASKTGDCAAGVARGYQRTVTRQFHGICHSTECWVAGHGRLEPSHASPCPSNIVLRTCERICKSYSRTTQAAPQRLGSIRAENGGILRGQIVRP